MAQAHSEQVSSPANTQRPALWGIKQVTYANCIRRPRPCGKRGFVIGLEAMLLESVHVSMCEIDAIHTDHPQRATFTRYDGVLNAFGSLLSMPSAGLSRIAKPRFMPEGVSRLSGSVRWGCLWPIVVCTPTNAMACNHGDLPFRGEGRDGPIHWGNASEAMEWRTLLGWRVLDRCDEDFMNRLQATEECWILPPEAENLSAACQ